MRRLLAVVLLAGLCPAPALADPNGDVIGAFMNVQKATSFHMEITTKSGEIGVDVVQPGKKHITVGTRMEMIMLGDDIYMKRGDHWMHMPAMGLASMATSMMHDYVKDFTTKNKSTLETTDLGMQTVNNESLHEYDVTNSDSKTHILLYIGRDGFPRMIVPKDQASTASITYSRWNDSTIAISAPI